MKVPLPWETGVTSRRAMDRLPSFWSRWACLAIALFWGTLGILVVLNLHVDPDNQRNIAGQLVMRTVYARDPGLWVANFVGVGSAIVVAAVELALRTRRRSARPGPVAFVVGSFLCLYSLFGLLYGVAAYCADRGDGHRLGLGRGETTAGHSHSSSDTLILHRGRSTRRPLGTSGDNLIFRGGWDFASAVACSLRVHGWNVHRESTSDLPDLVVRPQHPHGRGATMNRNVGSPDDLDLPLWRGARAAESDSLLMN